MIHRSIISSGLTLGILCHLNIISLYTETSNLLRSYVTKYHGERFLDPQVKGRVLSNQLCRQSLFTSFQVWPAFGRINDIEKCTLHLM